MNKHLYSSTKPFKTTWIQVDSRHCLKIKEYGNPQGIPVIFLHGGPGSQTNKNCIRFFDKRRYHVVIFDQRGCGSSRPLGELANNNTQELVNDIDKIRHHCGFKKVVLVGGSWGATLALLYMIKYPDKVISFIVTGFTLLKETLFTNRLQSQFPEDWNQFMKLGYPKDLKKTINKYFQKIKEGHPKYIQEWTEIETKHLTVSIPMNTSFESDKDKRIAALIESYYFKHNFFLPNNYIQNNLNKCKKIPGVIIHGHEDVICNPDDSKIIHKKLPRSVLRIINQAGHSYLEPSMSQSLIKATQDLGQQYFHQKEKFYLSLKKN